MVDAINNNRDAVYTGIGAAAGLAAGGAYGGWLSKPLLKGDAPSDAFVKRYYDNSMKTAAETAKKEVQELYKASTTTASLKTEDIAKKLGLSAVSGQESATDVAQKYKWDDVFADKDDLDTAKGKIDKMAAENATKNAKSGKELTKLKKAFEKLDKNADDNTVKEFVKKHAEILGESNKDISKYQDLSNAIIGDGSTKGILSPLEEAKGKILEHFSVQDGMKKLADDAKESTKSAFEAVKKAAKDTKLWAGAKWAAIGAAALGICSYIGAKMTAPKAPAETPSENA